MLATHIVDTRVEFWVMAGACAGVYLFYRGFRLLQRKRLIMNTPASKIRSAAMGLVEVSGLAAGPYTLRAPVTGLSCYYYRSMAWQWKREGRSKQWVKVADESMHVPFYLDDNTGRVLVNPQNAELDIHRDFQEEFSQSLFHSNLDIPANVTGFLLRHGVGTDCKLKVEEYCIKPKNALFILGTLATNPGIAVKPDPVRSETTHQFELNRSFLPGGLVGTVAGVISPLRGVAASGNLAFTMVRGAEAIGVTRGVANNAAPQNLDKAQQEKIASALAKAGITSPTAWAAAGLGGAAAGAAVAVAPETGATGQFDTHPPTVLMKGTHDPAFFISWRSQRAVVKSLGWKSALMIWGGPALTVLCVYILAAQFGWL